MDEQRSSLFENRSTIRTFIVLVTAICLVLLAIDLFYHRHGHFDFENWPGFYAFMGFVSYLTIVNSAKLLRKLVKRDNDYYAD